MELPATKTPFARYGPSISTVESPSGKSQGTWNCTPSAVTDATGTGVPLIRTEIPPRTVGKGGSAFDDVPPKPIQEGKINSPGAARNSRTPFSEFGIAAIIVAYCPLAISTRRIAVKPVLGSCLLTNSTLPSPDIATGH